MDNQIKELHEKIERVDRICRHERLADREEFITRMKEISESQDRIAKRLDDILKRFEEHESGENNELND
nr:hypothetical protein [Heyndrickxia oleronia]